MQINRIGSNVNFQKVIKVRIDGKDYKSAGKLQQKCCDNFSKVLNKDCPSTTRTKDRSKIRNFMKINHDDRRIHTTFRKIDSDFYIFTGKDAYQVEKIVEDARHDMKISDLNYKMSLPEGMPNSMWLDVQKAGGNQAQKDEIMFIRDSKLAEFAQSGGLSGVKAYVNLKTELSKSHEFRYIKDIESKAEWQGNIVQEEKLHL